MEEIIESKFGGGKLDDYWKSRYQDMKQDLSRFNDHKVEQDTTQNEVVASASYNLGKVSTDDYLDEVKYDLYEVDPEDDNNNDEDTFQKRKKAIQRELEEKRKEIEKIKFKQREEKEKEALEEYSLKAREEDTNESVSITEDEVTPTIIEDVKITDLTDNDAKKKT